MPYSQAKSVLLIILCSLISLLDASDRWNEIEPSLVLNNPPRGQFVQFPKAKYQYDTEGSQYFQIPADSSEDLRDLDEDIWVLEDKDYPVSPLDHYPGVGQVSGISALPSGDLAIFHRAEREWNADTFNETSHKLADIKNSVSGRLIKNDTIMILDRDHGGPVTIFGSNLFSMPHSVASDELGNLWVSDVARHQVMRLPTSAMQLQPDTGVQMQRWLPGNFTRLWPDIVLGEAFVPGNDKGHFCQPAELAISSDGRLVFVADGYCNGRIVVFTGQGDYLGSFGQELGFKVVHSLALMEERNLLCAADRENSRILCFKAGLDGKLSSIGQLVIRIQYPLGRVFALESLSKNHLLVSSNRQGTPHYDLAALNPFNQELKQIWTSSDLLVPHSLARTRDGLRVYAADMSVDAYRKVFKFYIVQRQQV